MVYQVSEYRAGGTAVQAFTDNGEPYASCSVCLAEYGYVPPNGQIVVPTYKLPPNTARKIVDDLADEVIGIVTFGPFGAEGMVIRLKPEYIINEI